MISHGVCKAEMAAEKYIAMNVVTLAQYKNVSRIDVDFHFMTIFSRMLPCSVPEKSLKKKTPIITLNLGGLFYPERVLEDPHSADL